MPEKDSFKGDVGNAWRAWLQLVIEKLQKCQKLDIEALSHHISFFFFLEFLFGCLTDWQLSLVSCLG